MSVRYRFADLVLDTTTGQLARGGEVVALQPLTYQLLLALLERPRALWTRDELSEKLWPDVVVTDASLHQVMRRLRRALGDDDLVETVPRRGYTLQVDVTIDRGATIGPVPTFPDRTHGRAALVAGVVARLDAGDRLVTLTGPGGVGKTRLATAVAGRLAEDRAVLIVELAGAASIDEVCRRVATSLPARLGTDPVAELGAALAARGPLVLALDDTDEVAHLASQTVSAWLEAAPELALLVTSRVALAVRGEHLVDVPPLDVDDASALYADRSGRDVDDDVAALVRALEGLPLAVELAASRARVLPPAALLQRIRVHLDELHATRPGDRPERHHSLRAVFDTSWELAGPAERETLCQLCAFSGVFRLSDAEATVDLDGSVADAVQTLVDHSLVAARPDGRLRILSTLRHYAIERAGVDGIERARQRLGEHLASAWPGTRLMAAFRDPGGPDDVALVDAVDDLVAASRAAAGRGDADVAGRTALAATQVLLRTGPLPLLVDLLSGAGDRVSVLDKLGFALERSGRTPEAVDTWQRMLRSARREGSRHHEGMALLGLARASSRQGELKEARALAEQSLEVLREVGAPYAIGLALDTLAHVVEEAGDGLAALEVQEQAVALYRETRDLNGLRTSLGNLGMRLTRRGRLVEARARLEEALALARQTGHRLAEVFNLGNLGSLLATQGHLEQALQTFQEAGRQAAELGEQHYTARQGLYAGVALTELGRLDEARVQLDGVLGAFRGLEAEVDAAETTVRLTQVDQRAGRPPSPGLLDPIVAFAERGGEAWLLGEALAVRAELSLAHGELDDAEADLARSIELARAQWSAVEVASRLCLQAELALSRGDALTAEVARAEAEAIVSSLRPTPQAPLRRRVEQISSSCRRSDPRS